MSANSIEILHRQRIPNDGILVIPSRLNFEQILHLEKLFADRKITWLIEENTKLDPATRAYLEKSDGAMFSVHDQNPTRAGELLSENLKNRGVLIFIPGQSNARNATSCHIPGEILKTLGSFGLPTLPIAVACPHESRLATESKSNSPVNQFVVGNPIAGHHASASTILRNILEAAEEAFACRPIFQASLATMLLRGLKRHASQNHIFDGSDDSERRFDQILGAAIALSKTIREETDALRVAIVLPPGKGGLIANLAVLFAGKVPVNLNFTAGHEAIRSSIRQAGVDRFITADPFVRKVPNFPWPPNRDLILLERVLPTLKRKIISWVVISKLLPSSILTLLLGLNKRNGDDEAILLFTSGSSGEPKGVALSHRNILANVCQFASRLDMPEGASVLGCLPLFHSFGCTVTLWYPVIEGIDLVTYPSPLETKRLAELIALHQVTLLLATPTFLRGYMKRIDPAQLKSLKLVVTGAEKLPQSLADAFEEKFAIRPQEGYGLTETSPATNVNLPDPIPEHHAVTIPSSRPGSVGQLLPGLAIRLTDPATDEDVPINHQGIIWFRGANVFNGYLNNEEKSKEVLKDGWFRTGDVGRVDEDGFLYIEGRISRFSKIAGEMVPHETVEAVIVKALGLDGESERKVAVVGVPDEQKGEAILLLSTVAGVAHEQECIDLRYKLLDAGLSSLWCPKAIIPVKEIPMLASGKLDIKGCEELAKNRA